DRSAVSPFVGAAPEAIQNESDRTSFEAFGNSYSINWFFQEDPARSGQGFVNLLFDHGKHAIKMNKDGARAGEWVIMWENHCDQMFDGIVNGPNAGYLGPGWHRKFSFHTFLFLDGHVEHRYFDTRSYKGPGWRISRKWLMPYWFPPFQDPPY